jgi:hypothetical protein
MNSAALHGPTEGLESSMEPPPNSHGRGIPKVPPISAYRPRRAVFGEDRVGFGGTGHLLEGRATDSSTDLSERGTFGIGKANAGLETELARLHNLTRTAWCVVAFTDVGSTDERSSPGCWVTGSWPTAAVQLKSMISGA